MDEATIAALLRFACRESGRPAGAVSAHPALAPARRRRGTGFSGSWIVDALAVAACAMLALTLLRSLERERDKEPVGGGDDAVIAAEGDTPADPPAGGDQSSVEQAAARADVVAWLSFRSLPLSERDEAERIKADPGTVKEITYAYVPVERVLKGEV
ncbi:MAG: hypothetical protein HY608_03540, partial [Planctomycetes bacterium]|nr:hypothetical protein [Planctomycetota bacterium]